MAKNRLLRYLSIVWDRDAARRMEDEAAASLERAGKTGSAELEKELAKGGQKGARALTAELQREFRLRMARAQQSLAEGLIDEAKFRAEGRQAAAEFNRGLSEGINKLKASGGGLTDAQYAGLASRFKPTGAAGAAAAGAAGAAGMLWRFGLAGPLAGVFTASAALSEAQTSIAAADELEAAIRKLAGTARLTGVDLGFLQENSEAVQEQFKLSVPLANDLTAELVKLTSKAGDINQTSAAMEAFLDIGAARGLNAQATLDAVGQAILGIDEGTDKLFGKNPSTLYEEFAAKIGKTATSLSDAEKAQALLDAAIEGGARVRGEYAKFLEGAAGQAQQNAERVKELRAEMGQALQPARELAGELKVGLFTVLATILTTLNEIFGFTNKVFRFVFRIEGDRPDLDYLRVGPFRFLSRKEAGSSPDMGTGAGGTWEANPSVLPGLTVLGIPELSPEEKRAAVQRTLDSWADVYKQRVQAMRDHLAKWMQSQEHAETQGMLGPVADGLLGLDLKKKDSTNAAREQFLGLFEDIQSASATAAEAMSDAFQDAFALMFEEGVTIGNFFEGLGRSMAGGVLQGLAQIARGKVAENLAYAIEMGAKALGLSFLNPVGAATSSASAGQHLAAAAAWAAIAGGAGAGAGAVRSRAPGSTFDAGLSIAQNADREIPPVIINIDPFNPANPVHTKQVGRAMELEVRLAGKSVWVGK